MHHSYRDNYTYSSSSNNRFSGSLRQRPAPAPFSQTEVYSGYRHGDEVDSGINAYDEEKEDIQSLKRSFMNPPFVEVVEKDVYSPYAGGMDVRLAQFVSQHNVNMDDGAIIYPMAPAHSAKDKKRKWVATWIWVKQALKLKFKRLTSLSIHHIRMNVNEDKSNSITHVFLFLISRSPDVLGVLIHESLMKFFAIAQGIESIRGAFGTKLMKIFKTLALESKAKS